MKIIMLNAAVADSYNILDFETYNILCACLNTNTVQLCLWTPCDPEIAAVRRPVSSS
jgi:hypothetical protein